MYKSYNYFSDVFEASVNQDGDEYDRFGRNYSACLRRQELEPWITVVYKHKKY